MTSDVNVCVIGAGVSGLTAVKYLKAAGVPCEAFEKGSDVGGLWRYDNDSGAASCYRSLHIDSSRQSLAYPDFVIPEDMPEYLSHWQVLEHFERYADQFDLRSAYRFRTEVLKVEPEGGRWKVTFLSRDAAPGTPPDSKVFSHVIVANGHLWDPKYPGFPGEFSGETSHSFHYRTADPFEGKRVLVVGLGNSAVDIAVDVARRAEKVFMSTRRSAWIMPKYLLGYPTDRVLGFLTKKLMLPVERARGVARFIAQITMGDQERFGVRRPKHPVWREHATISQELLPYLGHGWITMKPNVERLDGDEVLFTDASREKIDAIIYATGFHTSFPFLDPSVFEVKDGKPPALYRRIAPPEHPGLFLSGLVQPVGPTIPLVEIQARWIAAAISGRMSLPGQAEMNREIEAHRSRNAKRYLDSGRYTLEVDFREYAGQMDGDMERSRAGA